MGVTIRYLPLITLIVATVTVSLTAYLALQRGHVTDSAPYISDTGTLPPESCIFGQALNVLWIIISYAMYIKYRQVEYLLNRSNMQQHHTLNTVTLYIGLLAAFGSSIVANFQETNFFIIHWIGAVLVFGFGSLYQCMQTILYIHLNPVLGQWKLVTLRIGLAALSTTCFFILFICAMISYYQKKCKGDFLHWKKEDGGYGYHNISVVFEWMCASSTMVYLTLFSQEFKKITVQKPDVFIKE